MLLKYGFTRLRFNFLLFSTTNIIFSISTYLTPQSTLVSGAPSSFLILNNILSLRKAKIMFVNSYKTHLIYAYQYKFYAR